MKKFKKVVRWGYGGEMMFIIGITISIITSLWIIGFFLPFNEIELSITKMFCVIIVFLIIEGYAFYGIYDSLKNREVYYEELK